MAKNRREEKKRKILSYRQRASAGSNSFDRPSLNTPGGCNVVSWSKEGVYRYDILPYVLKKNNGNPYAKKFGLAEGETYVERTYYVHRLPGEGNDSYTCLKMTFGKACPVCDRRAKLVKEGATWDDEEVKALKPKQRQVFNFIDKDDEDKGVQVFDSSTFGFGELLETRINAADEDEGFDQFADLEHGKTLKITGKAQPGMKNFIKAVDIQFKDRKPYEDAILEKTFNLDDLIAELPYKELEKRFFAVPDDAGKENNGDEEEPEDDAPPARSAKPGKAGTTDSTKSSGSGKPNTKGGSSTDDDDDDLDSDLEPADQGDDADGESAEFQLDDEVTFEYKGKSWTGVIASLDDKKGIAEVEVEGRAKPMVVDYDDLTLVEPEEPEEDEDDDQDDEPPPRTAKKPGKKPEPTRADLDDDDDDPDSDMEPLDLDSDDEEEDGPRKKAPAKKPAGRR